ncbi:MAG: DUF2007 domain-containing protein [Pirellulales bacterium]
MSRLVCVFIADSPTEAHLVRNRLADYGIPAVVQNESLQAGSDAARDWAIAPRVMVPAEDAEFAREVAEDFETKRERRNESRSHDDWPADPLDWEDWPCCPRCRRRRLTYCPSCHTAGTKFPLAEFVSPESPDAPIRLVGDNRENPYDSVLVVCPTCDEAFTPQFYRRCENCGHEFGGGIDPPESTPFEETARQGVTWLVSSALFLGAIYIAWRLLR